MIEDTLPPPDYIPRHLSRAMYLRCQGSSNRGLVEANLRLVPVATVRRLWPQLLAQLAKNAMTEGNHRKAQELYSEIVDFVGEARAKDLARHFEFTAA